MELERFGDIQTPAWSYFTDKWIYFFSNHIKINFMLYYGSIFILFTCNLLI